MINSVLTSLGLKSGEVEVYLYLLEQGPQTVGNLAKKLTMARPSLYGFLRRLEERGVVAQSLKRGVKMFGAEPPEKIRLLFQKKIDYLKKQADVYESLLPELQGKRSKAVVFPQFKVFEGEEGLRHAAANLLLNRDAESQAFWSIKNMIDILGVDFFRWFNKERIRQNISIRAIWPKAHAVDIKKHPYLGVSEGFKREIRVAPAGIDFKMGYWLCGGKSIFITSRKETLGFVIESDEVAKILRTQFEFIWKASKPVQVDSKYTNGFLEEVGRE